MNTVEGKSNWLKFNPLQHASDVKRSKRVEQVFKSIIHAMPFIKLEPLSGSNTFKIPRTSIMRNLLQNSPDK